MASYLRMPSASADSDDGILQAWHVSVGKEIHEGEVIATVETDKASFDIESDRSAVVHALVVEPGAVVPVGDPIAVLLDIGEDSAAGDELLAQLTLSPTSQSADGDKSGQAPGAAAPAPAVPAPGRRGRRGRRFASPIARRLAKEQGILLEEIDGTGPGGRIVRRDVERVRDRHEVASEGAISTPAPAPTALPAAPAGAGAAGDGYTEIPHSRFRKAVAARLQASKQSAPHFYLRATVRVDALVALRAQLSESGTSVSLNDLFVKAAARAVSDVPAMNVSWTDEAMRQYQSVDIGVAIATEKGLVTPVVRAADQLPLTALAARIKDFASRVSDGRLAQHELEGGSLTVTNLGMYGVDEFAAIINPPQAAILAIGAVTRQPVVGDDGTLEAGSVVTVTLSVDHRPVDGVLAATWLKRLRELLENPLLILV